MKKAVLKALVAMALVFVTVFALASCDMLPESITGLIGGGKNCAHSNVEWVVDTPATCKLAGTQHSVCADCGKIVESNVPTEKGDHTPGDWEVKVTANCTREGTQIRKCTICKREVESKTIPMLTTHAYDFGKCTVCKIDQPASSGLQFVSNGDGTCTVVGIGSSADTSLIIPSESPAGDIVVAIGASAFLHQSSINSIIIPDSVTFAGTNAFTGTSITRASAPAAVISTLKCETLEELTITGEGPISASAMASSTSLAVVNIKEGVTEIGANAFEACSALRAISMPKSLLTIGANAFARCRGLSSVTIGSGVVSIGDYAFANSEGLRSIVIPASVKYIGIGAFACSKASNKVNTSQLTSAVFEVTEGWYYTSVSTATNGPAVDSGELANASSAASALNSVYTDGYLKRK